jgi:hypothetical protein
MRPKKRRNYSKYENEIQRRRRRIRRKRSKVERFWISCCMSSIYSTLGAGAWKSYRRRKTLHWCAKYSMHSRVSLAEESVVELCI